MVLASSGGITITRIGAANPLYAVDFGSSVAGKTLQVTNVALTTDQLARGAPLVAFCGTGPTGFDCNTPFGVPNDSAHVIVVIRDVDNATNVAHAFSLAAF